MEGILIFCCELKTLKQCSRTANQVAGKLGVELFFFANQVFIITLPLFELFFLQIN
jgi:hypothetical protein